MTLPIANKAAILLYVAFQLLCITSAKGLTLFEPKTYEECVLENIKNANNEQAVSAVAQACRNKFKNNQTRSVEGIKKCQLYWDGWKLVAGNNFPAVGFIIYKIAKDGVAVIDLGLPKSMSDEFKKRAGGEDKNVEDFLNQKADSVMKICAYK
jgi:hypothetical protein